MKKNQLIACIAAGVIAVGGAGTVGGIALHNHNKNQDALAALESQMSELADAVTATKTELVTETETETQPAPKPTETPTKPVQPTQAPQTTAAPPAPTEPEKITWEYDSELSRQVSELLVQKAILEIGITLNYRPDFSDQKNIRPENFVHQNKIEGYSSSMGFIKLLVGNDISKQIADAWFPDISSNFYSHSNICIDVFRYSNNFYLAVFNYQ